MESDPIGLAGGVSTYGYVGGSPMDSSDSLGLCLDSVCAKCTRDPAFCADLFGDIAQGFADVQQTLGNRCTDGAQKVADYLHRAARILNAYDSMKGARYMAGGARRNVAGTPAAPPNYVAPPPPPNIKWSAQEKHFPGHNSYTPGRSPMTSDPRRLAQSAGTGQQVGNLPVGVPGSKERVNFGETIGNYVDLAGNSYPTTNGIIHYSLSGIHIVPSRP